MASKRRLFTERRLDYLAAVHGRARGIMDYDHYYDVLRDRPDLMEAVKVAAESACRSAVARRGRPELVELMDPPSDIVERATDDVALQTRLLGAMEVMARQDPRWWGVMDPATEEWCRGCRDVYKIEDMTKCYCDNCLPDGGENV